MAVFAGQGGDPLLATADRIGEKAADRSTMQQRRVT